MLSKITTLLVALLIAVPAFSSPLPCNANGTVSRGANVYRNYRGKFVEWNWHWYNNYYARILKRITGPIVTPNGKVLSKSETFLLVAQADSRGCNSGVEWVLEKDFVFVP